MSYFLDFYQLIYTILHLLTYSKPTALWMNLLEELKRQNKTANNKNLVNYIFSN